MLLKVVQAIGAAESNVLDIGAPQRIDGNAAIALVDAAAEVSVDQYIMITALGTGKFGWPAGMQSVPYISQRYKACLSPVSTSFRSWAHI